MKRVCMVAYAHYFTDARIKAYVSSLSAKGCEIDILALKEPRQTDAPPPASGVRVFHVSGKYSGRSKIRYLISYLRFFAGASVMVAVLYCLRGYRIVHVHNMPNFIVFSALLPKCFGSLVVLDMHDLLSQTYGERYRGIGIAGSLITLEEKIAAAFADALICADDFQAEYLRSRLGIDGEKITVVMNMPDLRLFTNKGRSPSSPPADFSAVYHGTIAYRLGIDIILKAVAIARDRIPVKLHLFGAGDYFQDCRTMIVESGLENSVAASGRFFSVEDLPGLLKDMDVGIVGNRRSAAARYMLPVKMLEYMALGIPVLAPRLENIEHYVRDGEVCFYEAENTGDLAEKLVQLYEHPDCRARLVKKGLNFVRAHNWSGEVEKYFLLIGGRSWAR